MVNDAPDETDEALIWHGTPSQVLNIGPFVLGVLFCWLVLPALWAVWRWLQTRTTQYRITTRRIAVRTGVFNVRAVDMPLYRVKDQSLDMPLWLRVFGLGHIDLATSDLSFPRLRLFALPDPDALRERLHQAVERARRAHGVREIDVSQTP